MTSITRNKSAFTLLELSVVLLILSLMLGGILTALTQNARVANQAELKKRMDAIEAAVQEYAKSSAHYQLPCPAVGTLALTHASFGLVSDASACASINASYSNAGSASGTVPVRSLGLPDEYAFDPWGNKFTYVVGKTEATTNALYLYTGTIKIATGGITVTDTGGNTLSSTASMVLISHGPNGFGAFTREGGRRAGYSGNAKEQINCHCDSSAATAAYSSTFVRGAATESSAGVDSGFDDVVRYYERQFFRLKPDITTEKP